MGRERGMGEYGQRKRLEERMEGGMKEKVKKKMKEGEGVLLDTR